MRFKSSTRAAVTERSWPCGRGARPVGTADSGPSRGALAAFLTGAILAVACGAPDDGADQRSTAQNSGEVRSLDATGALGQTNPQPTATAADGTGTLKGVNFGKGECGSAVKPSGIPEKGKSLPGGFIELTFCVSITVDSGTTFAYDATKWGAWLGTSTSENYTGNQVEVVSSDASLGGTTATRSGKVVFRIKLPDNKIPDSLYGGLDSDGGRQRLKVTPFYSQGGKGPTDETSRTINNLPDIFMQNDIGAITAPPGLKKVTVSDGAFVVEFREPSSLAAEKPKKDGTVEKVQGDSNVSGYLVMYWNHDECKASGKGAWNFRLNPSYDKANGGAEGTRDASRKTAECDYPDVLAAGKAPCPFGCSDVKEDAFYGRSFEDLAIPAVIPLKTGNEGRQGSGCYTVVRVDSSAKSFGVSGLENGSTYGVSVFVLDSSGGVGRARSECARVTPQDVPLASREKGADLKRSDCFVVTAASGDSGSAAVHFWRLLRDQWIEETSVGRAFTGWYLGHGPRMAQWVEERPAVKKPLEAVLEFSGRAAFGTLEAARKAWDALGRAAGKAKETLSHVFVQEARAQDLGAGTTGTTESSTSSTSSGSMSSSTSASSDSTASPEGGSSARISVPSGSLYLLVGILTPSDDKDLWNAYYPKKRPLSVTVGQTFRLLDTAGELGLGAEFSYLGTNGRVPDRSVRTNAPVPAEVRGTRISFYSLGAALAVDYRLRIRATPWLAPRLALTAGTQRLREEIANPENANSSGDTQGDIRPRGAEGWSPILGARGSLEISVLRLWGSDGGSMRFSYGLEDLAFTLYAGYTKDLAKTMLRISGLHVGGGFAFLFL